MTEQRSDSSWDSLPDCGLEALDYDYDFKQDALDGRSRQIHRNRVVVECEKKFRQPSRPDTKGEMPLSIKGRAIGKSKEVNFLSIKKKGAEGVPFIHRLKQTLSPHCNIIVDGQILDNANKFSVDLCSYVACPRDGSLKKQIGFHLNPRLAMNCVVRNSHVDELWGEEEVHTFKRSPFGRGKPFVLEIFAAPFEYLVAVDGSHFCSFPYRVPLVDISTLEIHGDISLNKVELTTSKYYPATSVRMDSILLSPLEVPLVRTLGRSLTTTSTVNLKGRVFLLPFEFHVNWQHGSSVYPHPLIAFHMSARWRPSREDVVIFNSWSDGKWGSEVVQPMNTLFQPGADFHVQIRVLPAGFQVNVDGSPLTLFRHRLKLQLVDTLVVQGDVTLTRTEVSS